MRNQISYHSSQVVSNLLEEVEEIGEVEEAPQILF